jgi:hypothetical protein
MDITNAVMSVLPHKHKQSPTGWHQFHAVCCHHRGHKPDTRRRGNLKADASGISYHCFNCGFKTRFQGDQISHSFQQLLTWLGMPEEQIQHIKLQLLKSHMDHAHVHTDTHQFMVPSSDWPEVSLPPQSVHVRSHDADASHVIDYMKARHLHELPHTDWYYSTHENWQHRLIMPMRAQGRCVAYTGRYLGTPPSQVPKYLNSQLPPGYLFNWDQLWTDRKFVIVTEGPLDALAVQGVASLGSQLTEAQIYHLSRCDKHICVLPDRTKKNQQLIDTALTFGWSVCFPEWESHIKDAADACKAYGQIYTITSALAARTHNPLTIGVKRKWMPE